MVQRLIEGHEQQVLNAIRGFERGLDDKLKMVLEAVKELPSLAEIKGEVDETLRRLKEDGIVDSESLATYVRKELNDKYGLSDLCDMLKRAYSGDGQVMKAIKEIDVLLNEVNEIKNIIEKKPTDEEIAKAVADREKEHFGNIKDQLYKLEGALNDIRKERIRKMEKMRAIIEAGEQEFESIADSFLHEEFNPRYEILDVRNKVGAIGGKTGDHILERNGIHSYKITIDWKKTNPDKPQTISLEEARKVAVDALKNRKAKGSIVCAQLPEQLPPEAKGFYLFNTRMILTHFVFLRQAVELMGIVIELEEQNEQQRDVNVRKVQEAIKRLEQGNSNLEKTIRSLRLIEGCAHESISRLIDYQQEVADRTIEDLKRMI